MEEGSGHKDVVVEESKAASDEVESAERVGANDDAAAGSSARSYECIFCKRGFSTAQALGGHMNIHRKDRVRMAKSGPTAARRAEFDGGLYHPYNNPTHRRSTSVTSASASYAVYLPEATTSVVNRPSEENPRRSTRELSLFADDLHLGMGMHGEHWKGTAEDHEKIQEEEEEEEEEEEGKLDLELRLGNNKQ